MARPLICGFLKVRNEVVREGNIYRVLDDMERYCDVIVACDDASTDGTREVLQQRIAPENLILVSPGEQDFTRELEWKQKMLQRVAEIRPYWVAWMDADETIDAPAKNIQQFLREKTGDPIQGWTCHYTQLWRNDSWMRLDSDFNNGTFTKFWRWASDFSFEVILGTHKNQIPQQVVEVGASPFEVIHWGNYGASLVWKVVQYRHGLGGYPRHLFFDTAKYRYIGGPGPMPKAYTAREAQRILELDNMKDVRGLFVVVISAYNRADTLGRALESVITQSYDKLACVVVDDGSTDDTPAVMRAFQDTDPRIFYVRLEDHRGGVAANEVGMALACEWGEYWTRLGSDDWFLRDKLANDVKAFEAGAEAMYGMYVVNRNGKMTETCNPPELPSTIRTGMLEQKKFYASWANCAVKTSVLRRIREKYGAFADSRLKNMEDLLINARIAREVDWLWRGQVTDNKRGGYFVVGSGVDYDANTKFGIDAVWTNVETGASGDMSQYSLDRAISDEIIAGENEPVTFLGQAKKAWSMASAFPANKEDIYPKHAEVQEFDWLHGLRVLEYGCGGGSDAMSFLKRGNFVWYADIVPENIEAATKRIEEAGLEGGTPILLDASEVVPEIDEFFDVVSAHGVIHHIPEPLPVLREFYRVMRSGGFLYVMLYTEHLYGVYEAAVERGECKGGFGDFTDGHGVYARHYTEDEGTKLLESAGFFVDRSTLFNDNHFRTFKAVKP